MAVVLKMIDRDAEVEGKRIKKKLKNIDIFTISLVIAIFCYTVGIIIDYKSYYPKGSMTYEEMIRYQWSIDFILGSFFMINGIVFLVVCQLTIRQIKVYFPAMYEENKNKMRVAMFGLSLPLIFHSIFDLLGLSASFLEFKYNNIYLNNAIIFLFGYILPVGFQFSSLIFGFIRKRVDKQKSKGLLNDHSRMESEHLYRGSAIEEYDSANRHSQKKSSNEGSMFGNNNN